MKDDSNVQGFPTTPPAPGQQETTHAAPHPTPSPQLPAVATSVADPLPVEKPVPSFTVEQGSGSSRKKAVPAPTSSVHYDEDSDSHDVKLQVKDGGGGLSMHGPTSLFHLPASEDKPTSRNLPPAHHHHESDDFRRGRLVSRARMERENERTTALPVCIQPVGSWFIEEQRD